MKKPFVKVGDRVHYLRHRGDGQSKYRMDTWPIGVWMGDKEVDGTVVEYHPEIPATEVNGRKVECLAPWAVVRWDNGAQTVVDADNRGERWTKRK